MFVFPVLQVSYAVSPEEQETPEPDERQFRVALSLRKMRPVEEECK
jgi:hypothetical protein